MDDNLTRKENPFPDLVLPSQEIGLLLAVQAQLKSLDRLPPCKRKEDLQVHLTEMLNASFIPSYSSIRESLTRANIVIESLKKENAHLKDERLKESQVLPVVSPEPNSSDQTRTEVPFMRVQPSRLFQLTLLVIGSWIAWIIYHSIHS